MKTATDFTTTQIQAALQAAVAKAEAETGHRAKSWKVVCHNAMGVRHEPCIELLMTGGRTDYYTNAGYIEELLKV